MESNESGGAGGVNSHLLWSFMGTVFRPGQGFSTAQQREAFGPDGVTEKIRGKSGEEEAMGNERRCEVRASSSSSVPHSRQSAVGRMGISSGLHFLTFWENTLGQQGGWKKRRIQGTRGLTGLGSMSEAGRRLPALGIGQEGELPVIEF